MNMILLDYYDLAIAAALVGVLALSSVMLGLGMGRQLVIAALRTAVQLSIVGLILKVLFENLHLGWMTLVAGVMLLAAGREVMQRQQHRFRGAWGYGMGTTSMFLSSFTLTLFALLVIIGNQPWYQPQYAIPLLGMMLGNTMSGIALGLDRLTSSAMAHRTSIEARLMLGHSWSQAISTIRRESMRVGMIPMINAMAAAGLVSLPGMMTGQILAGSPPLEAVKYQILIMFLITAGTGFGTMTAVWLGARRLFDERQRLRLDRLYKKN
ncbi:MAG: iron export ABC transporter permease subunit FetB [Gammaproteobacteria bacterium]|nr:iron export ABC transporter permease subunit FetB [Gammaproteobacteria bacterium]